MIAGMARQIRTIELIFGPVSSDGISSPEDLIAAARAKGLKTASPSPIITPATLSITCSRRV